MTVCAGRTNLREDDSFGALAGGGTRMRRGPGSGSRDLDTRLEWERDILKNDGYYDERAMVLLTMCLGMVSRVVTVELTASLRDVTGRTTPLEPAGCILHEGNHFEFMICKVNLYMFVSP